MYELVAIGNALVDTEFLLTDEILAKTELTKGNMTLADTTAQNTLFATLSDHHITPAKQSGGGSAANSVVAFSALGGQAFYNCRVGRDEMGEFYLSDLQKSGVATSAKAIATGTTGSCAVLVTSDSERTMQTNLGASAELCEDNVDFDALTGAKYLYLEGYLAMSPALLPTIDEMMAKARLGGTKIVVSFADPAVVKFAKDGLLAWLKNGVDVIFCNLDEAKLFAETDDAEVAVKTLLTHTQLAVITCGDKPTYVATHDATHQIAVPSADVLDTNGAGDNFAGAFLYGLVQGLDLATCVKLGGAVASRVVAQFGARLDGDGYTSAKAEILG